MLREDPEFGGHYVVARFDYDPYGTPHQIAGGAWDRPTFLYTGHFYHAPTGLHLAPFRAYDPTLGRWLNRDPIDIAGGMNLYGYVGGDPINFSDPLGLEANYPDWWNPIDVVNYGILQPVGAGIDNYVTKPISGAIRTHVVNPFFDPIDKSANRINETYAAMGSSQRVSSDQLKNDIADLGAGFVVDGAGVIVGIKSCPAGGGGKGLGNPFKGKSADEIEQMLLGKGYQPRGPDPKNGLGGYVNPANGRSYHIDPANSYGEVPHVDVNRLRTYRGPLTKKKYGYGAN